MGHVQQIAPAGGRADTWRLLWACAAIVAVAGLYTVGHRQNADAHSVPVGHWDARHDLNAAEQGLLADLRVAADELRAQWDERGAWPPVSDLAAQGLPPFAPGPDTLARGDHRWSAHPLPGGGVAYRGVAANPAVAGALLLRLPAHPDHPNLDDGSAASAGADKTVWMARQANPALPPDASDAALQGAGWKPVTTRFDTGVTRH